mmetsp:Transcript_13317/g.38254  ORF Transcript_13317/g.38254 Transcript_13317/m.38254 type:complete len:89 (+) Transcript_13317:416-682(+)
MYQRLRCQAPPPEDTQASRPSATEDKKGKRGDAAPAPKAKLAVSFTSVEFDGKQLTPESLQAMSKDELRKVFAKLEPVVKAAKDLLGA